MACTPMAGQFRRSASQPQPPKRLRATSQGTAVCGPQTTGSTHCDTPPMWQWLVQRSHALKPSTATKAATFGRAC